MNMTRLKISKTLLAVTLGSVLVSGSALAEAAPWIKHSPRRIPQGKKSIAL